MAEEAGQQRYCRNCGAKLRSGMSFCVSCGTPVSPVVGGSGPSSGPDGPGRLGTFFDDLRSSFRRSADGLSGTFSGFSLSRTFSGFSTAGIRSLPRKVLEWFRGLPSVPKWIIVGVAALILLIILSPVARVLAGVLLVVSVIALAIRIYQKGPLRNWGLVAVASVVLMFTFGGISGALYGDGGETSPGETGGGDSGTDNPSSDGGRSSPVASSPEDSPAASPDASPAALSLGDEVDLTCEIHGYSESFDYDGLGVVGQVMDCDGVRIMAVSDWARGGTS